MILKGEIISRSHDQEDVMRLHLFPYLAVFVSRLQVEILMEVEFSR